MGIEKNGVHTAEKGFPEIETRIGLPPGSKIEKIIKSLSLFSGKDMSEVRHEKSYRYYVFSRNNNLSSGKYGSVAVIETPDGSKARYKIPQNTTSGNQYLSEAQEFEILFNPEFEEDKKHAIQRSLVEINADPEIYVTSPSFRKERWSKNVLMSDGATVEIAGDRCEILKEQPFLANNEFAGKMLNQIEVELVKPTNPPRYDSLLRARRMVIDGLRNQNIFPTDYSTSKSDWLKDMLKESGQFNSGSSNKWRM